MRKSSCRSKPVSKCSCCDGFTLLELLMAVSILVIMMSVAYGALMQLMRAKTALDDSRQAGFLANAVLNRLTRELQLAYGDAPLLDPNDAPASGATLYFSGESQQIASDRRGDRLTFIAQEGGQYLPDGGSHSGLVQITYRVEKNPEEKRDTKAPYYLIREEVPYMRPAKKAFEKILFFPVSESIESLQFSYYDGKQEDWSDSWGNPPRPDRLPTLVRLTLKTRSARGVVSTFTTLIPIKVSS